ncbi:MAG TPA: YbfB/YjiJ family MFS transporter [Alphaproteobacteria bacterium]|nr:YbfB/YjiJ family MFS transporter [Alphaproteobacteria bacterium]
MTAIDEPGRARQARPQAVWRAALSGLCAYLVGIGLARFAYTPLLPALISGHWFTESSADYLGAANLAGYLAGALLGRAMTRRQGTAWLLRAMMLVTAASLFACGIRELGFIWFFLWRFASGYTGGAIMVLAAPAVLTQTPAARRGLVGGIIFTGVGLGIAASGTLVPLLLRMSGLAGAWLGLGGLALVLTAIGWTGWPREAAVQSEGQHRVSPARLAMPVRALLVEYGLNAVGLVPHMVFLVVFIARGLGRGLEAGAGYWVLYGLGAIFGPLLTGRIADRIGFRRALRAAFLLQAAAVALLAVAAEPISLAMSSVIVGAFTPGIVPIALGRVHELVEGHDAQRRAWGYATIAFALAQAMAAYGCSFLFERLGDYASLFAVGACALLAAFALDMAAAAAKRLARRELRRPRATT